MKPELPNSGFFLVLSSASCESVPKLTLPFQTSISHFQVTEQAILPVGILVVAD
jgi:hypothetical protein